LVACHLASGLEHKELDNNFVNAVDAMQVHARWAGHTDTQVAFVLEVRDDVVASILTWDITFSAPLAHLVRRVALLFYAAGNHNNWVFYEDATADTIVHVLGPCK